MRIYFTHLDRDRSPICGRHRSSWWWHTTSCHRCVQRRCRSRRCFPGRWRERRTGSPLRFLPLSTWLTGNDKRIQSYMTGKWGRKQCLWLDQRPLWSWRPWTNGNVFPSPSPSRFLCNILLCLHMWSLPLVSLSECILIALLWNQRYFNTSALDQLTDFRPALCPPVHQCAGFL